MEDINWSNLHLDKEEAATRGTQIKWLLGIEDGTPVTIEQIKYLRDNVVSLIGHPDDNMQLFLNSITDFEKAADWLSKYSYSINAAFNLLDIEYVKPKLGWKGL